MGVPSFFASLLKKYSNRKFVFSKSDLVVEKNFFELNNIIFDISAIDDLYLDTNCLIHPVCFKVCAENQSLLITNPVKLEEMMIKQVIIYIEMLINFVNPTSLVYIAIDGVAPMAKIKHQRVRRFKTIIDTNIKEDIAAKHNIEYVKPWNNSAITPGTEFMEKLTKAIINYCNMKKKANINNPKKVKYIFSTANTPGEGEHKILQYIRSKLHINAVRVLYGLDADLLYLSLASKADRIYLLREITEFQNIKSSDGFCFVSIDIMRECIYDDMVENIEYNGLEEITTFLNLSEYKSQFIQDYVFMGFLLGNDFLPGLPSVNLSVTAKKLSGLDILMRVYKESFATLNKGKTSNYEFIMISIKPIIISTDFLLELFDHLNGEEEMYWRERRKYKRFVPHCQISNPYNIELHRMENLMFKIPDIFELGKDGVELIESKKKYYKHYYNGESYVTEIDNQKSVNNLSPKIKKTIGEYFKGLYWNSYYYFDKCVDYTFFFKHHRPPFVSDIFEWMLSNKEYIKSLENFYPRINDNLFLIHPIQQLFMVLPVQSCYLLPYKFKQVMIHPSMEEYFPRKINQDFQLISRYWQALPEIKIMEPYFAWDKIKNIKLTEREENRNKFKKPYELYV